MATLTARRDSRKNNNSLDSDQRMPTDEPPHLKEGGQEKEVIMIKQGHALRDVALRTLPFAIFVCLVIYVVNNGGWGMVERVVILLVSIALFSFTIFIWFPRNR